MRLGDGGLEGTKVLRTLLAVTFALPGFGDLHRTEAMEWVLINVGVHYGIVSKQTAAELVAGVGGDTNLAGHIGWDSHNGIGRGHAVVGRLGRLGGNNRVEVGAENKECRM